MKSRICTVIVCGLTLFFAAYAQTSSPLAPWSPPDVLTTQTASATALMVYKTNLDNELNNIIAAVNASAQKEVTDVAALQQGIQAALVTALAKDATSLPVCPTSQVCSFTIPACDISGVFGADPIHGPTQPSIVGCKAGWMMAGERLYYAQYVPLAGLYTFSVSVASVATSSCPDPQKGNFHLEIAGVPIFPADGSSVPVPRTATWSSYQTLVLGQVQLTGGVTKFAFVNDSTMPSCFDLLWLGFSK